MKWFAVIVFATTHSGNTSVVPVASEIECRSLINAIGSNPDLTTYAREQAMSQSACVMIQGEGESDG